MTLKDDVYAFIERSDGHTKLDELYSDFAAVIARAGFDRYVLTGIPELGSRPESVIMKTTYSDEWSRRYRERGYHMLDPIAIMSIRSVQPFTWQQASAAFSSARSQKVMHEASDFRMRDGFVSPMFDDRTFQAVVSLSSEHKIDLSRAEQGAIYLLSTYFKMSVDHLLGVTDQTPPLITGREREILSWTAVGKSNWEIAGILGIAHNTVRSHIRTIHRKLGVSATTHAVTKAIRYRLISP